jgi:hypothetical protein
MAHTLLVFTLVALATGCGGRTSPNAPGTRASALTSQASHDLARHFSATLSRQGGAPIDRIGGAGLRTLGQDAALGRIGRIQDEIGFSWSLSVQFFDAAGHPQLTYLHGLTARATALARARGRLSTSEYQATLGIERFLNVQGLLPASTEIEVDGTAHDTASCAFAAADGSEARSYDLLAAGTLEDLRQHKDPEVNPYPLSGVLRWNVRAHARERDAQGEREADYQARVQVTFNGTRHPTIEVEGTWRYRMDLDTGELSELPA